MKIYFIVDGKRVGEIETSLECFDSSPHLVNNEIVKLISNGKKLEIMIETIN